jgi:RNA polymerase sigma factor (sigma-70 family)
LYSDRREPCWLCWKSWKIRAGDIVTSRSDTRQSELSVASRELIERARDGDSRALSTLFRRQGDRLLRWARGRLPEWARRGNDTRDIVQDALLQTFRRFDAFQDRGKGALQAYLRRAVDNRIQDELRRVARRPAPTDDAALAARTSSTPSPLEYVLDQEKQDQYVRALHTLTIDEQRLVVGRLTMGYNYEQLAALTHRATAESARQAVRRAVIKLAKTMEN